MVVRVALNARLMRPTRIIGPARWECDWVWNRANGAVRCYLRLTDEDQPCAALKLQQVAQLLGVSDMASL